MKIRGAYLTSIDKNIDNNKKRYTSWYFCDDERIANNEGGYYARIAEGSSKA